MKQLRLLALLLVWGAFLGACGGSPQVQEDQETNEAETTEDTKESSENPENQEEVSSDIGSSPTAEESTDKQVDGEYETMQMMVGEFIGVEQGDYFYILVRTDQGEDYSFMVLDSDPFFDNLFENPDPHVGKRIKVWYMDTVEYIEEAGGEMEISKYHGGEWVEE